MPITSVDYLHGIINGSTVITELNNSAPSPMLQAFMARSAGQTDIQFVANQEQKPENPFETAQIKTMLDLCGAGTADLSAANTDLLFRKSVNHASRAAVDETVHKRFRAAMGLLEWTRINAVHNQEATISGRIICGYDGTNAPLVYAGTVAADSIEPSTPDHWTLGPCWLNDSQIEGVQSLTIDRGGRILQLGGDGELYPTFEGEQTADPIITIVTPTTDAWSSIGLNGVAVASASCYLRKMATTARVGNATASHIKFAAAAGLAYIQNTVGNGDSPNMTTITIIPAAASATVRALLISSTAVAITS